MGLGPAGILISHHPRPKSGSCDDASKGIQLPAMRHCHCLAGVWLLKVFCKEKCHKGWEE